MVRRRSFLFLAILGFGVPWILHGVTGYPSEQGPPNRLVIGIGRDFFDGPDSRSYLHGSTHTWEALTYLNEGLRAEPWLAESWRSENGGRTWSFLLRPGVRFHDGSSLTIEEVVACLERIRDRPKYDPSGIYRNVESIKAQGQRVVIFRLRAPSPSFPNLMAYYSSPILKPALFDREGRITRLVATGPFQVERVRRGESIELFAFQEYWGPRPAFQKVVFRTILDAQSRIMALLAGELDAVADVGGLLPEQAPLLASTPGIVLKRQEVATTHYLFFNCRRPPFSDSAARRWAARLVDRKEWTEALTHGCGMPAKDLYSPLAKDWSFGIVLPSSGRKPPAPSRSLVILLPGIAVQRWPYLEMAQVLQERLGREGFPARIQVLEAGPYQEALKRRDFDLLIQPNTLMTGDPDFFFSYYLASEGPNNFGYRSSEADRLIREARHEMDPSRRRSLYRRLVEMANRDLPVLPLYHDVSLYAYRDRLVHFQMDHNFRPQLIHARSGRTL